MKKTVLCGVSALAFAALAGDALAGGFAIREQSVKGQGSSFAGVAAGSGGLSSMFWNPATTSLYNQYGFISETNQSLILPNSESALSSGNIGVPAIVPAPAFVYGWNEAITLGASLNAPVGLTTNVPDFWVGSAHGDKSAVKTYNFSPNASYKLNDMFTIGMGAQIEFMEVELTSRSPASGAEIFNVDGDDLGFGFTAGVLFEPTDTTDIGIGFRSSVNHTLKGDGFRAPAFSGPVSAKFKSPEMVTLGIRQQVSEELTLLGGVEWTNWSRFKELRIVDATGATVGLTPENWDDSWYFSAGAEYAYNDALTLRAGAAYEKSPVPDAFRTPRAPDNDRIWLSAGASYKFTENMTAHLAYSHVFMDDGDVNLTTPTPLNTTFKQHLDIVSIGLTRDW